MAWLGKAAEDVAATQKSVRWQTPLGLPVIQPYRRKGRRVIKTLMQNFVVEYEHDELPVVKAKQRSAFPPNYIHSIDSSHMMLTAIACNRAGISFAGVHDSFWTHAGTTQDMNQHLREAFVDLHSQPLLEDLKDSLELNFDVKLAPTPVRGNLDLNCVMDSDYFFS